MKTANKIILPVRFNKKSIICFLLLVQTVLLRFNSIASAPTILRLEASGNNMQNETVVYFDSTGSASYNYLYDAPSLGTEPGYLNIVTRLDNMDFQIKDLPLLTENISVPVKITTGTADFYEIYAEDLQNLPSGAYVTLHDNYTNADQDLRTGSYNCFITDTEQVARFVLNINILPMKGAQGTVSNPTCSFSSNGFIIAGVCNSTYNYYWKDSSNNIIKTSLNKLGFDTLNNLNAGIYSVDITVPGTCRNATLTFTLQGSQSPRASFISNKSSVLLINDSANVSFTNTSLNANSYWWDFGDGSGNADTNTFYSYANTGTFTVTLSAFSSACNETSTYTTEITVTEPSTGVQQLSENTNNSFISRDENGYFIQFNYSITNIDAIISVYTIQGEKAMNDLSVNNAGNQKVYIDNNTLTNQPIIISCVTSDGKKTFRKMIAN